MEFLDVWNLSNDKEQRVFMYAKDGTPLFYTNIDGVYKTSEGVQVYDIGEKGEFLGKAQKVVSDINSKYDSKAKSSGNELIGFSANGVMLYHDSKSNKVVSANGREVVIEDGYAYYTNQNKEPEVIAYATENEKEYFNCVVKERNIDILFDAMGLDIDSAEKDREDLYEIASDSKLLKNYLYLEKITQGRDVVTDYYIDYIMKFDDIAKEIKKGAKVSDEIKEKNVNFLLDSMKLDKNNCEALKRSLRPISFDTKLLSDYMNYRQSTDATRTRILIEAVKFDSIHMPKEINEMAEKTIVDESGKSFLKFLYPDLGPKTALRLCYNNFELKSPRQFKKLVKEDSKNRLFGTSYNPKDSDLAFITNMYPELSNREAVIKFCREHWVSNDKMFKMMLDTEKKCGVIENDVVVKEKGVGHGTPIVSFDVNVKKPIVSEKTSEEASRSNSTFATKFKTLFDETDSSNDASNEMKA